MITQSQIEKQEQKLNELKSKFKAQSEKLITEWTSISKTEEISKQVYNEKTYAEILTLLRKGERIADYPLLQELRNSGKYEFLKDFWVFVPNPDKISLDNKYVAGFSAGSGGADFDCDRYPDGRIAGLGVFVVRRKVKKEAEEK